MYRLRNYFHPLWICWPIQLNMVTTGLRIKMIDIEHSSIGWWTYWCSVYRLRIDHHWLRKSRNRFKHYWMQCLPDKDLPWPIDEISQSVEKLLDAMSTGWVMNTTDRDEFSIGWGQISTSRLVKCNHAISLYDYHPINNYKR